MSSGSPVESVRRAFALLEELNRQRINSVQHLHEVTALPKSTIVRLLETLSAPRLRGERSTTGRIPGDLGGSHTKLRLPW